MKLMKAIKAMKQSSYEETKGAPELQHSSGHHSGAQLRFDFGVLCHTSEDIDPGLSVTSR